MRVLLVDDSEGDYLLTRIHLEAMVETKAELHWVSTYQDALAAGFRGGYDVVLVDYHLGPDDGLELLRTLVAGGCTTPIILLTGQAERRLAVEAMKAGAFDYLVKDEVTSAILDLSLRHAIERGQVGALRRQAAYAEAERERLHSILMHAPAIMVVFRGRDHIIEFANPPAVRAAGSRDLLGRRAREAAPELTELGAFTALDHVFSSGETASGSELEVRLEPMPNGEPRQAFFNATLTPLFDPRRCVEGILLHAVDVTEQVMALRLVDSLARQAAALAAERTAIIEQMPGGVVVLDERGRMLIMNEDGRRISRNQPNLVSPAAEHVGVHILRDPHTGRQLTEEESPIARALAGEAVRDYEYMFRRDGEDSDTWIKTSAAPLLDEDGAVTGVVSVFLDVTTERMLGRALEASEERFKAFMDNSSAIAIMKNEEGHYVYVNAAYERRFGRTLADVLGKSDADLWPPGTARTIRGHDLAVLQGTDSVERLISLPDMSGEARDWLTLKFTLRDIAGGRLLGTIAVDITERLRAERALAESEQRYRRIFETAQEGIWVVDAAGNTVMVNKKMAEIMGSTVEETLGLPAIDSIDPRDTELALAALRDLGEGREVRLDIRVRRADRREIWSMVTAAPLTDADGRYAGALGMYTDITERRAAEQRTVRHVSQLSALRTVDLAITASQDLRHTLGVILEQLGLLLHMDAGRILLLNRHTSTLEGAVSRGFESVPSAEIPYILKYGWAERAMTEERRIVVSDLSKAADSNRARETEGQFIGYIAVPLIVKGQTKGVLEMFQRSRLDPDAEWLDFLESMARQAAIAIDHAYLFDDLQLSNRELVLAYDTTIEGWSRALDLRDKETEGHSRRVTEMVLMLAQSLHVPEADLPHVRRGALLHDIGKMGVPDHILLKPGPLTEEEWVVMRMHPVYAYELLSPIGYLHQSLDIPYCHHEKWDGSGYPRSLRAERIPLAARIFALADVYDALSSDRPYRGAWQPEKVRAHIVGLSGTHFEPAVVEAFLALEAGFHR
jgi:PAS domain S-box-containing protein